MTRFRLPRRAFLKGLGGFGVALPALEVMQSANAATPAPKRFIVSYGGLSTGNIVSGTSTNYLTPKTVGAGYEITQGLAEVGTLGMRDHMSIVSGLKVPWAVNGVVPAGGRCLTGFHYVTVVPQVCGGRMEKGAYLGYDFRFPSVDQVVADAIGTTTRHRSLLYRVQAAQPYVDNFLSFRAGQMIQPTASPRLAWSSLFSTYTPTDPAEVIKAKQLLNRRKSVLDLVRTGTEELMPKLGVADRQRLSRHFDEIRSLETRIDSIEPPADPLCKVPADPGPDPGISNAVRIPNVGWDLTTTNNWANEELRGQVLGDLIHMAFVCDLSRVASFMLTNWKCEINSYPMTGKLTDVHGSSHMGDLVSQTKVIAWFVKHFTRLAAKFRDTPDVDGQAMLANTVMALIFEGGHGFDADTNTAHSTHSTENMVVLVAGGTAGGIKPGRHVVATGMHPAHVMCSAMKACGLNPTLGETSGVVPGLFA